MQASKERRLTLVLRKGLALTSAGNGIREMGQQPPNDTLPPSGLYPPHQPDILRDRSARISRARSRTSAIHGRTDPTAFRKVAGARPDIPPAPLLVIHWPACSRSDNRRGGKGCVRKCK